MISENRVKLRKLLSQWPSGTVGILPWLNKLGICQQLAYHYAQSGWLKKIGPGAYIKIGDTSDWMGGLFALQAYLNLPIHLGGKSALEIAGYGHFISPEDKSDLYLFALPKTKLPSWFIHFEEQRKIIFKTSNLFLEKDFLGITKWDAPHFKINISSPERAILEVLSLVPNHQSIEEASLLLEALGSLRSELLQSLLENCHSIKVKRLFLALSESFSHAWFDELKLENIDIGTGNRSIHPGGKLHPKYLITLPNKNGDENGI